MIALEESIKENGILSPIIVTPNNECLEGHSRLILAERLALKTDQVPISVFSGPAETAENMAVALNAVRRSWTREVRLQTVKTLFKKGWSQRRISKAIAASTGQVNYDLRHLGLIEPPKPAPEPKPEPPPRASDKPTPKPDNNATIDDESDDDFDTSPLPPDPEPKTKTSPADLRQRYIDNGFKLLSSLSRTFSALSLFKAAAEALGELKDLLDEANKGL